MSSARDRGVQLGALLWLALAAGIACARIPYDDEWFSIELALQTDSTHFWSALAGDGHPPWVALLDRGLGALVGSRYAMHFARVLASAAAFALSAGWIARRLRIAPWAPLLGALHPIVLMYGGAARWYPFLLLGHALRARALWGDDRPAMRRGLFVGGALVGAAASYLDLWFLAHDAFFWVASARARRPAESRSASVLTLGFAVIGVLMLLALSPLGFGHVISAASAGPSLRGVATFFALGLFGEAGFGSLWLLLGLFVVLALGRALATRLRERPLPIDAAYLLSLAGAWAVAAAFGAWHARYGLWPWFLLAAHLPRLQRGARVDRVLLALTAAFAAQVLLAMASPGHFYKLDLNALTAADCRALHPTSPTARTALTVVPHPRLAALIEQCCTGYGPLLRIPSIRIVPDPSAQLRGLDAALQHHPPTVALLRVNAQSSLVYTDERVRASLAARCRQTDSREFGDVPHRELRRYLAATANPEHRFTLETWDCR